MSSFGSHVTRNRWLVVLLWGLLAWVMMQFIPVGDPADSERTTLLPEQSRYTIAMDKLAEGFPNDCALSTAVVVVERLGAPLSDQDKTWIASLAKAIGANVQAEAEAHPNSKPAHVSSPGELDSKIKQANLLRSGAGHLSGKSVPSLCNPTRSQITEDGQAAIIRVAIPANFVTIRSARLTGTIRETAAKLERPDECKALRVGVTGTGGFGHDYADFVKRSQARTSLATVLSVIFILLIVYRGILAALVPLVSISLAVVLVLKGINFAQNNGCAVGTAEKLFVFVLMYGAGIDYSILLISRFREFLQRQHQPREAIVKATDATKGAIFASAGTDAMGVFMLIFSQFLIFRTTGPVVAISLLVAMVAALTLVPALVALSGRKLFWPRKIKPVRQSTVKFWDGLARFVLARPAAVLVGVLLLAGLAMANARNITWVYNAITGIPVEYALPEGVERGHDVGNAPAGVDIVTRHWAEGEVSPVKILLESPTKFTRTTALDTAKAVTIALANHKAVNNVRSYYEPFGLDQPLTDKTGADIPGTATIRNGAKDTYLTADRKAMRFEAILLQDAMSNKSIALLDEIRSQITTAAQSVGVEGMIVHIGGATAQMEAIRDITSSDFKLMVACVLGVIILIVFVLLRDIRMTLLMAGLVVVSYLTTLGLVEWIYPMLFGAEGLDWKVQMFLFVVMAAVGVDYNIFLAARIEQEAQRHNWKSAVHRAMVATGPVISSAGLIMAVTLGSLTVGHIVLLRQMGLALGLGFLVDTFVIRPLVLPSAALLLCGKKKK
ncbi:MAG: MMPL family transporter [Phycisphaerales bacterium]|nr:MMPL family transporter [Phycisphaerales bacterium]